MPQADQVLGRQPAAHDVVDDRLRYSGIRRVYGDERDSGPGELSQLLPGEPAWLGPLNVETQDRDPASTLMLYRQALSWCRKLQAADTTAWILTGT
jgi:hypothetical protein